MEGKEREKLKYLLYGILGKSKNYSTILFYVDDACHLGPYVNKVLEKHDTELTRYFADRKLAVDFLHFKVRLRVGFGNYLCQILLFRTTWERIARNCTTLTSIQNFNQ